MTYQRDLRSNAIVVIGFGQAALPLDFVNQLRRLRDDGIVRLVDAVFVSKDEHGDLNEIRASDLSEEEAVLLGTLAGALFGYGAAGEEGVGARRRARRAGRPRRRVRSRQPTTSTRSPT